jgi:hypothetical protein
MRKPTFAFRQSFASILQAAGSLPPLIKNQIDITIIMAIITIAILFFFSKNLTKQTIVGILLSKMQK